MPREVGAGIATLVAFALIAGGVALLPNVVRIQTWVVRENALRRFVLVRRHMETRAFRVSLRLQALVSIAVGVYLLWILAR